MTLSSNSELIVAAQTPLPTRHGQFNVFVFRGADEPEGREHVAIVSGDVSSAEDVPVRMHSECLTSEVLGSLKCDCREQLEAAMKLIAKRGAGVIVYLRQEGRGIGLANKIRAYDLQSRGHDTVDANRLLGLPDDAREYHAAADMLAHLGVKSIVLLTNNPAKVSAMRELGVTVTGREPVLVPATPYSAGYLDAKRERMQHLLPARAAHAGEPFLRAVGGPPGDAE